MTEYYEAGKRFEQAACENHMDTIKEGAFSIKDVPSMKLVSVREAAQKLNMTSSAVCRALVQGKFPFGFAVENENARYSYYIFDRLLCAYCEGRFACSAKDFCSEYFLF